MSEQELITTVSLAHSKTQHILELFKKPIYKSVIEDLSEWIANLQIVDMILRRIIDEKLEKLSPPETLQNVIATLGLYETKLNHLEKQGKIIRFFVSHRMRKQLDHLNSSLCMKVASLESEIKSKSTVPFKSAIKYLHYDSFSESGGQNNRIMLSPSRVRRNDTESIENQFIKNSSEVWTTLFGKETFVVPWATFVTQLKTKIPINPTEESVLRDIIDHTRVETVNHYKFTEFLKGFGPLESCVHNAVKVYHENWFHGFMSREEAKRFLETEPFGTFLVRFSSTRPASFAISYVGYQLSNVEDTSYQSIPSQQLLNEAVKKVEALSVQNLLVKATGYGFILQDSNAPGRVFKTLREILTFYSTILRIPFTSDLPEKSWFHGDLQGDDAEDFLAGQPVGTFLVRFSSKPGSYATSFVGPQGKVQKALLSRLDNGKYRLEGENPKIFGSIQEFVKEYMANGIFKLAFRHNALDNSVSSSTASINIKVSSNSNFYPASPKSIDRSVPSFFLDDLPCVLDENSS